MKRADIERAAAKTGVGLDPETVVDVAGQDPILKSSLHLGEGAATVLALLGQEANRIWTARGGRPQSLSVDARHAAASLKSYTLLRVNGERAIDKRPVSRINRFWRCGDGRHIYLHQSFYGPPPILEELRLPAEASDEAIAAAVRERGAFELEDAIARKGLCAAVARTQDEWLAHPQGKALAAKIFPVEVTRIGDAPPQPFPEGERPLAGIRVLDLTRVLAGPVCARTLAEHGADVLHVASPKLPTVETFEIDTGHGKRQSYVDLDEASACDNLRDLIRGADVFSQGFRQGALERRGFGVEAVAALRPGIVYVSENAYGHLGPWRTRPGWEQLAQTVTGVAALPGLDRPALAPAAICDYTTGYFAALGTMIALRRRATEGGSWLVTVSLSQTAMWYLSLGVDLDPEAASGEESNGAFMSERQTAFGAVSHLAPPLRMSQTTPQWALPVSPLGSEPAAWL
jgi:CoA transferase family III